MKVKKLRKKTIKKMDKISFELKDLMATVSKYETSFSEITNSDLTNIFEMKVRLKHMIKRMKKSDK